MTVLRQRLPTGLKRALIVASAVWMIGYYLTNKETIEFSLTVGASTPSTMCSDVYEQGDDRLGACEAAGPGSWSDRYLKRQRGEQIDVPFDHYQKANHNFSVWYWLFGVPLALFLLTYAALWVREGFHEGKE